MSCHSTQDDEGSKIFQAMKYCKVFTRVDTVRNAQKPLMNV